MNSTAPVASMAFPPLAISPVYGLAEATLTVTLVPPKEMASTELLPLSQFTVGQALPEYGDRHRRKAVVSCGRPIQDARCEVRGTDGTALPDMAMGEIWVSSPGVMRHYWREPTPVGEPLRDGWLDTGDLGFMRDGEFFVSGRLKDVIFHRGRQSVRRGLRGSRRVGPRREEGQRHRVRDHGPRANGGDRGERRRPRFSAPSWRTACSPPWRTAYRVHRTRWRLWRPGWCRRLRRASARGASAAICTFPAPS